MPAIGFLRLQHARVVENILTKNRSLFAIWSSKLAIIASKSDRGTVLLEVVRFLRIHISMLAMLYPTFEANV